VSGLSQLQRGILRLALTVNMHTQGGVARVKAGATVPGYRVPTVDYAGPKDLRPPLAMWALAGATLTGDIHNAHFRHDAASLSRKASITRATTRLLQRGLLVLAPNPDHVLYGDRPKWGYVLTAEGMAAAGTEPMDLPLLAEACELFGITPLQIVKQSRWEHCDMHQRQTVLITILRNGYHEPRSAAAVTVANGYRQDGADTAVTDGPTATDAQQWGAGNRCEVQL